MNIRIHTTKGTYETNAGRIRKLAGDETNHFPELMVWYNMSLNGLTAVEGEQLQITWQDGRKCLSWKVRKVEPIKGNRWVQ